MSAFLRILENEVQIAALFFMAAVYALCLNWIFRFRPAKERTREEGSEKAGLVYSLTCVARPLAMEATRRKPFFTPGSSFFIWASRRASRRPSPFIIFLYAIHLREIKFDPRPIACAAKFFHLAGESRSCSSGRADAWDWAEVHQGRQKEKCAIFSVLGRTSAASRRT